MIFELIISSSGVSSLLICMIHSLKQCCALNQAPPLLRNLSPDRLQRDLIALEVTALHRKVR